MNSSVLTRDLTVQKIPFRSYESMVHYEVKPATNDFDDDVVKLFEFVGLDIDPTYWERAYSPEQGVDRVAQPFVLWHREFGVVGFAAIRPRVINLRDQAIQSQMLFDFVIHPSEVQNDGVSYFLKELIDKAEITFAAGCGLEASRVLERERFLRAGTMDRYVFDPKVDELKVPTKQIVEAEQVKACPDQIESLINFLQQNEMFHFDRDKKWMDWMHFGPSSLSRELLKFEDEHNLHYLVVSRTVEGLHGNEMQVTDAFCMDGKVEQMAHALAHRAKKRKMPIYMSFFGGKWEQPLLKAGFRKLRPRWPFYWMIRDPKQRSLANILLRKEMWHFFPVDGEIDHY